MLQGMTDTHDTTEAEAPQADPLQSLIWLQEAGADEAMEEAPVDRFAAAAAEKAARQAALLRPAQPAAGAPSPGRPAFPNPAFPNPVARPAVSPAFDRAPPAAPPPVTADTRAAAQSAEKLAKDAATLDALKTAVEGFDLCPLKAGAQNTVFADGNPKARIMLIGEAPGRDEDRQGVPFVGRAGQLLDKMLAAIHLDRTQVYITNVMNWRPPGNREPTPQEAEIMLPFLRRHIELADPGVILTLGAVATHHVLGIQGSILRMRGTWMEYNLNGRSVPLLPFLHPAYLLRQPGQKKLAWHDLLALEEKIHALKLLEQIQKTD